MVNKEREDMGRGCIEAFGSAMSCLIAIVSILLLMYYFEIGMAYIFVALFISILLLVIQLKLEIIPIIRHLKSEKISGTIIKGNVDISKGVFGAGKFVHSYYLKGYYTYEDNTYYFQDYFFYDDVRLWCAIHDMIEKEDVPCDIVIFVDTKNHSKYKVKGLEYIIRLKELYPQYLEQYW